MAVIKRIDPTVRMACVGRSLVFPLKRDQGGPGCVTDCHHPRGQESGEGGSGLSSSSVNFACCGFINKSAGAVLTSPSSL